MVCEDNSVNVVFGGLSETSLGRGPLDTDSPAGLASVVSDIAIIFGGGAVLKEGGKVTSEETDQGGGGVLSRGFNFNPGFIVSGLGLPVFGLVVVQENFHKWGKFFFSSQHGLFRNLINYNLT